MDGKVARAQGEASRGKAHDKGAEPYDTAQSEAGLEKTSQANMNCVP